jgi:hypothetical protein
LKAARSNLLFKSLAYLRKKVLFWQAVRIKNCRVEAGSILLDIIELNKPFHEPWVAVLTVVE